HPRREGARAVDCGGARSQRREPGDGAARIDRPPARGGRTPEPYGGIATNWSIAIAQEREARINSEISAPEVRLIGVDGEQIGIVPIATALQMAEQAEVDLVEIAPGATPPVCRLMDYGKFKYRESKKRHEAKLKQKQIVVKEVKFRPGTDEGDYQIKLRNLIRFLEEGDKTKVTLRFRGREMAHQEFGIRLLERVRADLEPYGVV